MWSIPAGNWKHLKQPMIGAKREFYEETNIHITNKKLTPIDVIDRYSRDGAE
jgi:predicted NUDIX family NTP pyrophosphohydrolase